MYKQSFHNTINEQGKLLFDFEYSAQNQEDLILSVFRQYGKPLAWFEVRALLQSEMNESSLKRSITNLSTEKVNKLGIVIRKADLRKTEFKVLGPHGKNCYRYELI